jgi:hypothetical protein
MRRRDLLLAFAILASVTTRAATQTYAMDRGVWLLSGSASLAHSKSSGSSSGHTGLGITTTAGYFVVPGLALSANFQFGHSAGEGATATSYGVGPGISYYFGRANTKLHPYLAAAALYQHQSFSNSGVSTSTWHSFTYTGSGGLALLVARNVGATGEVYYMHSNSKASSPNNVTTGSSTQYGTRFGLAIFIY